MMSGKKVIELNPGLIRTKGEAVPSMAVPQRGAEPVKVVDSASEPLNFKVTKTFRKEFKQAALDADLKQVQLLTAMLELWKQHHSA